MELSFDRMPMVEILAYREYIKARLGHGYNAMSDSEQYDIQVLKSLQKCIEQELKMRMIKLYDGNGRPSL